jgi:hypothetical protein
MRRKHAAALLVAILLPATTVVSRGQSPQPTSPLATPPATIDLAAAVEVPIALEEPAARQAVRPGDYAGQYGVREIRLEPDGRLVLQREGGPPLEMVPAGPDAFTLKDVPQAQIQFVRDAAGAVTGVRILNRDGQWETVARERR